LPNPETRTAVDPLDPPESSDQLDDRLPDSFFAVLGSWEDNRSAEEILRDIRGEDPEPERTALK
jgi:hypothetical protein